jgi:hypothetical protein
MHEDYQWKRKLLAVVEGVLATLAAEIILYPVFRWLDDYYTSDNIHDATNLDLMIGIIIAYLVIAACAGEYCFRLLVWNMSFPIHYELMVLFISAGASFLLVDIMDFSIILFLIMTGIPGIRLGSYLAYVRKRRPARQAGSSAPPS